MAKIKVDKGDITFPGGGSIDGVPFATLRNSVVNHGHNLHPTSTIRSEYVPLINARTTDAQFYCRNGAADWFAIAVYREHDHGTSALAHGAISVPSAPSPTGSTLKTLANGHIECRTLAGYAPEAVYYQFAHNPPQGHSHSLTGTGLDSEMLPQLWAAYGIYDVFWMGYLVDSAFYNYWDRARCNAGAHSHSRHNLSLGPYINNAPTVPFGNLNRKFRMIGATGHIETGGRVNGIGIAEFKSVFDAHTHWEGGDSGELAQSDASLRDSAGNVRMFRTRTGTGSAYWEYTYFRAAAHAHKVISAQGPA
jgi:hypothetical protein